MIYMGDFYVSLAASLLELEQEKYFEESIASLPAEDRIRIRAERDKAKEKQRQERAEERRHQELCGAIKQAGKNANPLRFL